MAAAVDDATDFAEAAPDPDPATLLRHVYAEPDDPARAAAGGLRRLARREGRA